jgi:hypothetical protein
MSRISSRKIVVIGGYGTFGSLISEQLLNSASVVIAGHNQHIGGKYAASIGAEFVWCDINDKNSVQTAISHAAVVINASGPFRPNDYFVPQACIEAKCHYIDLADNRAYVKEFRQLHDEAKSNGVFACTGASTTPAVTSALVFGLMTETSKAHSIEIYLSAGNRNAAGVSTFESILAYVGVPIQVWRKGRWEWSSGWGLQERIEFPAPVGKRLVQLCDVPDLELFPELFGANEVMFKAGLELPIFNIGLSALARVKELIPRLDLVSLAKPLVKISRFFKSFGSYAGGVMIRLEDKHGHHKSLSFTTSQNGPRLPTAPAVLLTRKILTEGPPDLGAFPCVGLLRLDEFRSYLEPFGFQLISLE